MKKTYIKILAIIFLITLFTVSFNHPETVKGSESIFEIQLTNSNGESHVSHEDFKNELENNSNKYEIQLRIKSLNEPRRIKGMQIFYNFSESSFQRNGPVTVEKKYYDENAFSDMGVHDIAQGADDFMLGHNTDAPEDRYFVPTEFETFVKFTIGLKPSHEIPDTFEINLIFDQILEDSVIGIYDLDKIIFTSFKVGGASEEPDASLQSLSIKGQSGIEYITGANPLLPDIMEITISYQDSLSALAIVPTKKSTTAIMDDVDIGLGHPYQTDNEITIRITEGIEEKIYKIIITVIPAKTDNNLNGLTTSQGSLNPGFDPNILDYTINLPYTTTALILSAAINSEDKSVLDNPMHDISNLSVGPDIYTFMVTAEDGSTKTYTIEVIRAAASSDVGILGIWVNEQVTTYDAISSTYEIMLDEAIGQFVFKVDLDSLFGVIEYKLSTSLNYLEINRNTNTSNTLIDKDQTTIYDIRITAQEGTQKIYTLSVSRQASSNTEIQSISVTENAVPEALTFSEGKYSFRLKSSTTETISFQIITKENATFQVQDTDSDPIIDLSVYAVKDLPLGITQLTLIVTAQNGVTQNYPIEILKQSDEKQIQSLSILDRDQAMLPLYDLTNFTYDLATMTYTLNLPFIHSKIRLNIVSSSASTMAHLSGPSMTITGHIAYAEMDYTLLTEQTTTLIFKVIAENNTEEQYTIRIIRAAADQENKLSEILINGVLINDFDTNQFNGYEKVIVSGGLLSIEVTVQTVSALSSVTYNGNISGEISLVRGVTKTIEIRVTAQNLTHQTYQVDVVAANDIRDLSNLSIDSGTLTPEFDPSILTYELTVPFSISNTQITLTPADTFATVTGDGLFNLSVGLNERKVYVTSEAGIKGLEYTLIIHRQAANSDKLLDELTVKNTADETFFELSPMFSPAHFSYSLRVDDDVASVLVNGALPLGSTASITGNNTFTLTSGSTRTITLTVTAEDSSTQVYTIDITRANDITTFDKVIINGTDYTSDMFTARTLEISDVLFSVTSLNVEIIKSDDKSTVLAPGLSGNTWTITVGLNTISFHIRSQYGTQSDLYEIKVTRQAANSDKLLDELTVKNTADETFFELSPMFSPTHFSYTLRVNDDVTSVLVNGALPLGSTASITGNNTFTLTSGSTRTITLTVTAEDSSTQVYTIAITRANDITTFDNVIINGTDYTSDMFTARTLEISDVLFSVTSLNVEIIKSDDKSTVLAPELSGNTWTITVGLNTISFHIRSQHGTESDPYEIKVTRQAANSDKLLDELTVKNTADETFFELSPMFSPTHFSYTLRVDDDVASVLVNGALPLGSTASITGNNTFTLTSGSTRTITLTVTAEDSSTQVYTIAITRANDITTFDNVIINGTDYTSDLFTARTLEISDVLFSVTSLNVEIIKSDDKSTVLAPELSGNTWTITVGLNTISFHIRSQYGTQSDPYEIKVTRLEAYTDAFLSDLNVKDLTDQTIAFTTVFDETTLSYTIELPNDSTLTEIMISAAPKDLRQQIAGHLGNHLLNIREGGIINQVFSITVTAETGQPNVYTITILKGTTLSSDHSIKSVSLKDLNGQSYLTFNHLAQQQTPISLPYVIDRLILIVISNDANATVVADQIHIIHAGETKVITFSVVAQDGSESMIYEVAVQRDEPSSDHTLRDLKVLHEGNDLIVFHAQTYVYQLKMGRHVTQLRVEFEKNNPFQTVTGDIGTIEVVAGFQQIKLFVMAQDGHIQSYVIDILVVNSIASLNDLTVIDFNIEFDQNQFSYNLGQVTHAITSIEIQAEVTGLSFATITGIGVRELSFGHNRFEIIVRSEDMTQEVIYEIVIERLALDQNNLLLDLYVTDGENTLLFDQPFDAHTLNYTIILTPTFDKEHVHIFAQAQNGSTPTGLGQHVLTSTNNFIYQICLVQVTAEDESVRTYQITVIKNPVVEKNDNHDVLSVAIKETKQTYHFMFDVLTVRQSSVILNYEDDTFFLEILAHPSATVVGQGYYMLLPGESKVITFKVIAENGDASITYELPIERHIADGQHELLEFYLIISGSRLDLDLNQTHHTLDLEENVSSLEIFASAPEKALVNGLGIFSITQKNQTFYVTVIAENGDQNIYAIHITRKSDDTSFDAILINGQDVMNQLINNHLDVGTVPYATMGLHIEVLTAHPLANAIGQGYKVIPLGSHTFEIIIISELGISQEIITIHIEKVQASSNAYASLIVVRDAHTNHSLSLSPVFHKLTQRYTIDLTLYPQVTDIWIEAFKDHNQQKEISGVGLHTLDLSQGISTEIFYITVTAENEDTLIYEIHVIKHMDAEDNVSIASLSLMSDDMNHLGTSHLASNLFDLTKTQYLVVVPYEVNSVTLTLTNNFEAVIFGLGTYDIIEHNVLEIQFYLISKSGLVQSLMYDIEVIRDAPSDNSNLASLSVNGIPIDNFEKDQLSYSLQVTDEMMETIFIDATLEHPYASLSGDIGEYTILHGENTFYIHVMSQSGHQKTYTLHVYKVSNHHEIIDIEIVDLPLNEPFDPETLVYEVTVPYSTQVIQIQALSSPFARLSGTGEKTLHIGVNKFEVYAVSETDQQGQMYTIIIYREPISSDSTLKDLYLINHHTHEVITFDPGFRSTTTRYVLNLEKDDPMTAFHIHAEASHVLASVGGIGYKVLKSHIEGIYHTIFEVVVKAEDGTTTTYSIDVYKDVVLSDDIDIIDLRLIGSDGVLYLGVSDAQLSFVPTVFYYEMTVPFDLDSMTLEVVTDLSYAYGMGTKKFDDTSLITYETYIVSQSGKVESQSYIIKIHRHIPSDINTLDGIWINGQAIIGFDSNVLNYELSVDYLKDAYVLITATKTHEASRIYGDIGVTEIKEGKNTFTLTVVAENGDINNYVIIIHYHYLNPYLASLVLRDTRTLKTYGFDFDPYTFEYTIEVSHNTTEVNVSGMAIDQQRAAIIGLGHYDVLSMHTRIVIYVLAKDLVTLQMYTLNLVRGQAVSSNKTLENLSVPGYQFDFNPQIKTYHITVNQNVNTLDVFAKSACEHAVIEIIGHETIKQGNNIILVKVTAQDQTFEYYQIHVERHIEENIDNHTCGSIVVWFSILVWMMTLSIFVIKSKKPIKKQKISRFAFKEEDFI